VHLITVLNCNYIVQQVSSFEVPYLPDDKQQQQQQSEQLRLKGGLLGAPCRAWELACIQQQQHTATASASAIASPATDRRATQSNKRISSRSAELSPAKAYAHPGTVNRSLHQMLRLSFCDQQQYIYAHTSSTLTLVSYIAQL
jgi:hypothetical protein